MFGIPEYHKSLETLHYGCEKPRAYFVPFADEASALADNRDGSVYFKNLCGDWNFKWYPSARELKGDTIPVMPADHDKMIVPMNWQMALGRGYADTIRGFENLSHEECTEMGLNDSMVHEDFMIGAEDLDIDAITRDGRRVPIFRKGNWAF